MEAYFWLIIVVWAGGLSALWLYRRHEIQRLLITFSGAYLFAVIVFHLLPEIYGHEETNASLVGVFILLGLLFQLVLDFFSHGVEHGHSGKTHAHTLTAGIVLGLFLHAFTEGLPVADAHHHAYLYAILVHKFPIALTLTAFLKNAKMPPIKMWSLLTVFSLMSPLGAWAGEHFPVFAGHHGLVSAFVVGVLTHISTTILFESDSDHRFHLYKFLAILVAFGLAYLM